MTAQAKHSWYIARSGTSDPIIEFDTCLGVRYKSGSGLPIKPVENGSFFTANKWAWPFQAVVEFAKMQRTPHGGDLMQAMEDLDYWKNSVEPVDVVTPYRVFKHANIFDLEYRFDNDETGVGMIIPVITLQEIREINTSISTTKITRAGAKNPDHADVEDVGQVSAKAVSDLYQYIGRVASFFGGGKQ